VGCRRRRHSGAQAVTTVPAQFDRAVLRSYETLRLQRQILMDRAAAAVVAACRLPVGAR
jgi:NAD(P)H-hydrate repair Nnr-like enzyme with NAD(P)H-hydrate epimerase domain